MRIAQRRTNRLLLALAAAAAAAVLTAPATLADGGGGGGGHEGGARVALTRTTVLPNGAGQWLLTLHLINESSGSNLTGMEVLAGGSGPRGAVLPQNTLFKELGRGDYQGELTGPAGPWSVSLNIREVPGNALVVLPFSRTISFTASEGGGGEVAAGTASASATPRKNGGGSGGLGVIGVVLGIGAVGAVSFFGLRARKLRAPA